MDFGAVNEGDLVSDVMMTACTSRGDVTTGRAPSLGRLPGARQPRLILRKTSDRPRRGHTLQDTG